MGLSNLKHILMLIFLTMSTAQAAPLEQRRGGGSDGGGLAIVFLKEKDPSLRYQLYDYYEKNKSLGWTYDLGPLHLSPQEKLEIVFKRIEKYDTLLAGALRERAKTYYDPDYNISRVHRLTKVHLPIMERSESRKTILPEECADVRANLCREVQVAIQQDHPIDNVSEVMLNMDMYNLFDNNHKAALDLHEMLYSRARKHGITEAPSIRYATMVFVTNQWHKTSMRDYLEILRASLIGSNVAKYSDAYTFQFGYQGITLEVNPYHTEKEAFYEDGSLYYGYLPKNFPPSRITMDYSFRGNTHTVQLSRRLNFSKDGMVIGGLVENARGKTSIYLGETGPIDLAFLEVDSRGLLKYVMLDGLYYGGGSFPRGPNEVLSIPTDYENRNLVLSQPVILKDSTGKDTCSPLNPQYFLQGILKLDEQGRLVVDHVLKDPTKKMGFEKWMRGEYLPCKVQ